MTIVGIIGLGVMGKHMAANLIKGGYEVIGYDRSPDALTLLAQNGGKPAASAGEVAAASDVVITMLPDSPHVKEVALGADGIAEKAKPGTLYIDMSTIRPDVAVEVASECRARGLRPLDAPVSGGEKGAIDASLSIMVGGEKSDFAEAEPILNTMGSTVVHLGPAGSGQTVKAANQLLVGGIIELNAEAIVFLDAHGVDMPAALKVLRGGLAGNRVLEIKGDTMLEHNFEPGFRIDLHHKDMGIVTSAAREAGVVLPLGALVAQLIAAVRARGDGGLDHTALLKLVEALAGK